MYVYTLLHQISRGGVELLPAQVVFAGIYLVSFYTVVQLYRLAGAPPVLIPFLALSKRLHSIFVLRLFNDPITMLFVYLSMYLFCTRKYMSGCAIYSYVNNFKLTLA